MTKPRATWVLWVRFLKGWGWQRLYATKATKYMSAKEILENFIISTWGRNPIMDGNTRILPAGRKPK